MVFSVVSLKTGPVNISIFPYITEFFNGGFKPEDPNIVILNLRLSRIVLALVVGASLAMAGVVYQGVLLNPLADPYTLGVSTGAAFGASIAILFGFGYSNIYGIGLLPLSAFSGSIMALCMVYVIGHFEGKPHPATLILGGIIVSTFLSALISLLKSLHEESISSIVFWIMGSLSGKSWKHVLLVLPYFFLCGFILFYYSNELDILSLGDIQAQHLGVPVARIRIILLLTASLLTAASVSITGIIGFVGLVVPHLVRYITGPKHGMLLFYSLFVGAILLLGADTVARAILKEGQELPVGVVTALIGGPFFCVILISRRKTLKIMS